jgi:hypothetical protein
MPGASPRLHGVRAHLVVPVLGIVIAIGLAVTTSSGASAAEPAPAATPGDYRTALTARLAKEYGDAQLASQVVAGLDPDLLVKLEARVPLAEVATSPFLSYKSPRVPARDVDSIVAFSFGNRVAPDGAITAGPTNEALAATIEKFVKKHPVPVFAQQEIARILQADGVKRVTSIDPVVGPDGQLVYLSTAGAATAMVQRAAAAGVDLGTVGVMGFADHVVRCVLTARGAAMDAAVPSGVVLPKTYDPQSGQPWTRDRAAYLPVDLIGRITTL